MASSFWPTFLPEATLLQCSGEERRQAGQAHFSEVLLALLHPVSHPQLRELAEWACAEAGTLHTSQISLMRNNKTRMLGTKAIDALGRLNQLAWVAVRHPELLPLLGCAPVTPRIERLLSAYKPLLDPTSQEPLGSGALLEIYLGLRRQPIEWPRRLNLEEAEGLAGRLGDWLEAELRAREISFREASRRLQELWEGEAAGARKLVRVLAGLEEYTAKQVADGWARIAGALLSLLDRQPDIWALAEELLAPDLPVGAELGPGVSRAGGSAPVEPARKGRPVSSANASGGSVASAAGRKGATAAKSPKGRAPQKAPAKRRRGSTAT
ncbi:MAG: hypothetical protein ACKO8I_08940 [Cyanobacteriota bacterium]